MPALDGIRAVAVAAVLLYHGGVSWLPGGFFGVDTFFVLSGFLITSLLLGEWHRTGTIRLRRFWGRRARRLLPALLAVVLFVVCYAAYAVPSDTYPGIRGDALSAIFYVANWHFVLSGSNYFAQTALASPLTHTWSLAIEEQFYLLWPLVVLATLRLARRPLRALWWASVIGAGASGLEMALLARTGASVTRLYYGTDTHAQSLLVGTALAVALFGLRHRQADATAGPRDLSTRSRKAVALAGFGGAAGLVLMWGTVGFGSALLFQGGFLLASISAAAVLLAAVSIPNGALARALSVAPLRFLGRISYGIYLWHYPLFIWLDGARTGLQGVALLALRVAVTVCVATVSFFLLERPIRHGGLLAGWRGWAAAPIAVGLSATVVVLATSGASLGAPSP
ncbi:MAG: acyltransferase family protein, partial [Acidimicrobiales bacterium]